MNRKATENGRIMKTPAFDFGLGAPTTGNLNNEKYNQNYLVVGINPDLVETTTVYQLIFIFYFSV